MPTADERWNIAGLDSVMNVLQTSPWVKKLPASKDDLLHAFFRDDSVARMKGEPIAMWLVRFYDQLSKLNRVGVDIVTALPDVAGWQALNLAGLTEDRIERVVSRLPDEAFPLDKISAELNRVFASVHMNEPVSSAPAVPPGRAWSSNERERVPRPVRLHHRWTRDQSGPASSTQRDTFEEVRDTEEEDNDGSGDYVQDELEVLATCMDNDENHAPIPGVDVSQLERECLKLAELPEALAIVQAARRGTSHSSRHFRGSSGRAKLDQHLDVNVYLAVRVISDIMMTEKLRSSEGLNVPGPNLSNAEVRTCMQSWTSGKSSQRLPCV